MNRSWGKGHRISLLMLLACLLFSPWASGQEGAAKGSLNIVLITIDTLRPDHLSCYGYGRPTSPTIDTLAEDGVLFTYALATSSWTASSIASLLTSLYTAEHGVRNGLYQVETKRAIYQEVLRDEHYTLTEALKKMGYATFGIASNLHLTAEAGFAQGFDKYVTLPFEEADRVNRKLEEWKKELEEKRPFFLWVHYIDPHWEYHGQKPWIDLYDPNYSGPEEELFDTYNPLMIRRDLYPLIFGNEELLKHLKALYDSEINYVDERVGRLLAMLPKEAQEDALVVVTSDHGEGFLEHGLLEHSHSLYEEVTRVPLIMRFPSWFPIKKGVVKEPVSIIDIMPTLLSLSGHEPWPHCKGKNLLEYIQDGSSPSGGHAQRLLICELSRFNYRMKSALWGRWKLIWDLKKGREELFDLHEDPQEQRNLASLKLPITEQLKRDLQEVIQIDKGLREPSQREMHLDQEAIERLKSLGYLN